MRTILIVDDVPANLSVLIETLGAAGFRVLLADSGEMALEVAASEHPELILLDVCMPRLDGLETCRRLRAAPATAEVRVIFVTALDDVHDKVAGLQAGAVDYVTKPLEPAEVLARVRVHLELRDLQARLAERNAELESARRALGQSLDRAVIVATLDGQMLFRTERASRLLERHFSSAPSGDGETLPMELLSELARPGETAREEMATAAGGLRLRWFADLSEGECVTLWLEEAEVGGPKRLAGLGLTPRECEVLWWIAQGKSNPEISIILASRTNTVKKQVQNILEKLGCESRLAAALRAKEVLDNGG